jgi:predicted O-methyltransferase YrrM
VEAFDTALRDKQLEESVRRLPGPAYYRVLKWIHTILEPANYVEIGIMRGVSLDQARHDTPRIIGIDPTPNLIPVIARKPHVANAEIYELTSDEFFERYDLTELLGGPVALAFIDGLHLFEQVLRDFAHLERHSNERTLILLHDCIPFNAETASRERTTDFYCGDVWKAPLVLGRLRPDLKMVTVPTAPTGLCLVTSLDSGNREFERKLPVIERTYRDLDFDYYLAHRAEMPDEIPNKMGRVGEWLRAGPLAQS